MSTSTELSPVREVTALQTPISSTVVAVAVPPLHDGTPNCAMECAAQASALQNLSPKYSEEVHHLYARMHSLIDSLIDGTPS